MRYISTRGKAPALDFEGVLLQGLASDGGLYVPETLPRYTPEELTALRGLTYDELASRVMLPFVEDSISEEDFRTLVHETYAGFRHRAVAPLVQLDTNEWLMELFCGPTLAFKDFALQLLGRLLDYFLQKRNQQVIILGATSGDTGSAAIEGCRHSGHVDIFILHPHGRVSEVQRRQMTTVHSDNVHNIAVKGNFDDCQRMVKASFADQSFLPEGRSLVAVNSINWARIMAQIVYYIHAALALGGPVRSLAFSVPTGNFGHIFAGYLAREMGLPIQQLVVATNQNDILHRFISRNQYEPGELQSTLSPSMDITISSNFERLLFDLCGRDSTEVVQFLDAASRGAGQIEDGRWQMARKLFDSLSVDDQRTCEVIAEVYRETGYLLDPHSAIGVEAARRCRRDAAVPMVTMGTAHPAKFPEAVERAGVGAEAALPAHLADLLQRKERFSVLEKDLAQIQEFMARNWRLAER